MKLTVSGFHPFHIVSPSPWPLLTSLALMSFMLNSLLIFNKLVHWFVWVMSVVSLLLVVFQWWRDVVRESTFSGFHSSKVVLGLNYGMLLFILSELSFFGSFFWSLVYLFLEPGEEVGYSWPPQGIQTISFLDVPLLNTLILLSSGVSITWAHHSILKSEGKEGSLAVIITVLLGVVFSSFQFVEYEESSFTIMDSAYGSLFFLMTGFHGLHVIVGIIFITVSAFRINHCHYSNVHHLGFEFAAWYWHFVDVVWLLLYVMLYWIGS